MAFDHKLLEIIACPLCKGKLNYDKEKGSWCVEPTVWPIRSRMIFLCCWRAVPVT